MFPSKIESFWMGYLYEQAMEIPAGHKPAIPPSCLHLMQATARSPCLSQESVAEPQTNFSHNTNELKWQ